MAWKKKLSWHEIWSNRVISTWAHTYTLIRHVNPFTYSWHELFIYSDGTDVCGCFCFFLALPQLKTNMYKLCIHVFFHYYYSCLYCGLLILDRKCYFSRGKIKWKYNHRKNEHEAKWSKRWQQCSSQMCAHDISLCSDSFQFYLTKIYNIVIHFKIEKWSHRLYNSFHGHTEICEVVTSTVVEWWLWEIEPCSHRAQAHTTYTCNFIITTSFAIFLRSFFYSFALFFLVCVLFVYISRFSRIFTSIVAEVYLGYSLVVPRL